jgi:pimeloyl-ACP methyl ester carboxylesterase
MNLEFDKVGSGYPVVFLHGLGYDKRIFQPLIDKIQDRFCCYTLNLPGVMNSSGLEDYSLARQASAIGKWLEESPIRHPILVGHSMGGYIGLEILAQFPDLLSGLCLLHSHCYPDTPARKEDRFRKIDFIEKYGHALYMKQAIPSMFTGMFGSTHVFLLDSLIQVASRIPKEVVLAQLQALLNRNDHADTLKNSPIPILSIAGKQDTLVAEEQWKSMALLPAISKLLVLDPCIHMGMYEHTLAIASAFAPFAKLCQGLRQQG